MLLVGVAGTFGWSARASALVWPDVTERVERDLTAADPATRRAAAKEIHTLGPTRGASLALAALQDPDEDVRLAAAEAAIRLRAAGATDAIVSWLNAPEARLRHKACEVARALPSPRAVAPLARTLGDPESEVRAAAADALGRQATPEAVAPLLGRLDDPTPTVRVRIVVALAALGDPRAVVPLVSKVQESSPEVRQAVARALGDLGDRRASPALVLALRDPIPDVRREAIGALGSMRAGDAVDSLAPFLVDRIPSLRLAALAALGQIATADAVRLLVGALGGIDDASGSLESSPVREALLAAGAPAVPDLRAVLAGSPSPQVATGAAWTLGKLGAHAEATALVQAMRRGVLPAAAALHALAGAGTIEDVPIVLEFVADASPAVRAEAIGAAAALLDPNHPDGRAVEPLVAALRDSAPSLQERAKLATLLGRTGAPRATTALVELARAQDPTLRLSAIDALGTLGPIAPEPGPNAAAGEDLLLEALRASDPGVRLHAAVALAQAGTARARDALVAALNAGDEVDRAAVLTALGGVLSRAATPDAVARLGNALGLAAGPERDAIIEALGRAPIAPAVRWLGTIARSTEPSDRRMAAALCAAHPGDAASLATARALTTDPDGETRAQAVWALGAIGDASDVERLVATARGADGDAATNAAAATGRILGRLRTAGAASPALCPFLADVRPLVRANALAGLALAGARCSDGSLERSLLTEDTNEDVRAAAALALANRDFPADTHALARCAQADPSGRVAARCSARSPKPTRPRAALVYVVPQGADAPRPAGRYALLFSDGMLRVGTTDRRGAVFDPAAPEGDLSLRKPGALSK
jgi:HEAT repeat protein